MSGETNSKRDETKGKPERRAVRARVRASRTSPPRTVPIAIESGTAPEVLPYQMPASMATEHHLAPRPFATQIAYRQLITSGLSSTEAAGLIGFVAGLATNVTPWTMSQVNRMLFLRSLYRETRWGEAERRPAE